MFGTWKYDAETDEVQSVRNAFDPLKCSGDKNGCERCLGNNLRCEYTRSGYKSSRKGKKSSRKSAEEESPASGSGSSSRRGGSSSKRSSGKHSHSSSSRAATSGHDEPEGLLSQFDFSSLSPEDGFDLGLLSPGAADQTGGGYTVPGTSAAASQGIYPQMQMQQGASDVSYQSWDGYSAYPPGYGQQPGYQHEEWDGYGEYPGQQDQQQDPRYWPSHGGR
ncbi:hypothetical protein QQX98_007208 [Neonectria punicea]|uniref:Zn(2)-C6 fungal-type domain-containing protein n=1 Tax=Neonectria punicea TaxID=979145 RepID=A0ABR1GYM3_9HYPO